MLYAKVGQHHLARTTETSPELNPGTLSCLSAQPPALAFLTETRPQVVTVSLSTLCPICILQAHGGDAIPRLALCLWTIERLSPFRLRFEHTTGVACIPRDPKYIPAIAILY